MAKLTSVFGDLASSKNLQLLVDTHLAAFNVPVWKRFWDWGNPTVSIDFATVIGKHRVEAMASIVDRDSRAPLRSKQGLERLSGQVPSIKEMFHMTQTEYREYLVMKQMQLGGTLATQLDLLFNYMKIAGNAAHKTLDVLTFQALSTGKIVLNTTNNPDGIVTTTEVDLLMPSANKYKTTAANWGNFTTANPIEDIEKIVEDFDAKGIRFDKILMPRATFNNMKKCTAVKELLSGFYFAGVKNAKDLIVSLDRVNEFLLAETLPVIELVDSITGVEKDGVISTYNAWTAGQVSFVPSGKLGIMHNAACIEQLQPVTGIGYATYDRALLSKWQENDPWGEYTQVELNAMPGWETIEQCAILDTTADPD